MALPLLPGFSVGRNVSGTDGTSLPFPLASLPEGQSEEKMSLRLSAGLAAGGVERALRS